MSDVTANAKLYAPEGITEPWLRPGATSVSQLIVNEAVGVAVACSPSVFVTAPSRLKENRTLSGIGPVDGRYNASRNTVRASATMRVVDSSCVGSVTLTLV